MRTCPEKSMAMSNSMPVKRGMAKAKGSSFSPLTENICTEVGVRMEAKSWGLMPETWRRY
jgi:hypothetical protein